MKLSTVLIMILVMDLFCFYGVLTHDAIMSYPSGRSGTDPTAVVYTPQQIGNRALGIVAGMNETDGTLTGEVNETSVATFTTWAGDVGIAVLSAIGQYNIARDVMNAINFMFQLLTSPFVVGTVIGLDTVWFAGLFIWAVYLLLIGLAALAAIRGGET